MNRFTYYILSFAFCFGQICADWIKLPEINLEHVSSGGVLYHFDKPIERANQTFVKVSIEKNSNNFFSNVSLPKTPHFYEDLSNIFATQKPSIVKNMFESNHYETSTSVVNDRKIPENFANPKRNESRFTIKVTKGNQKETDVNNLKKEKEMNDDEIQQQKFTESTHLNVSKLSELTNIIRTIQQTIFANIPNALKKKREYLKIIHDNILINLEHHIGLIWPRKRIEKRGIKGDDHHLDFPSSEAALMTIGFLTFAVFLIKLVMQVINVLKAKKMMTYTPMLTAMGRSLPDDSFKPGLGDAAAVRILRLMEDFKND